MAKLLIYYLLAVNLVAFTAYGIDKRRAKRDQWRISESMLLMLAILGGSIGAWLGMRTWRHKTQHAKFKYGIPLIIIVQITLVVWAM